MDKKILPFLILLVTFIYIIPAYGTNHYVDKNATGSNNGSSWSNAWESFSAISWSSVSAGDVIYISGGSDSTLYTETLNIGKSGSSGNNILITKGTESGHNGKVVIDGQNSLTSCVNFGSSQYVTIDHLSLNYATDSNVKLRSNNNIVQYCSFLIHKATYGIDLRGSNCQVLHNIVETSAGSDGGQRDFIQSTAGGNNTYAYNYIRIKNETESQHTDCFQFYNMTGDCVLHDNFLWQDNHKTNNAQGIYMTSSNIRLTCYNNIIYFPYGKHGIGINNVGGYSGTVTAYNNTLYGGEGAVESQMWFQSGVNDAVIKNNISYSANPQVEPLYFGVTTTGSTIDYNVLYNGSSTIVYNGGGKTWNQWQSSGYDNHGYNSNPLFRDAGSMDFKVESNSDAVDRGESLNAPYNTDYAGLPRPQGQNYDMGAYEYDGGNPNPDTTPPEVTGASITNQTTVVVSFSEALQASGAQNAANYSISGGITVTGAVMNGTQVTLTTSSHSFNQQYTVTVSNVKDLAGNLINPNANSAQYILEGDTTPPEVTGASITNQTTVVVSFSEALQASGAQNAANYSISGGITVTSAVMNGTQVTLTTSSHSFNQQYTVTVSNVKDLAGNLINPNANSAQYMLEGDTTPPEVTGASILAATSVSITFSEALEQNSSQTIGNYSITNGITVSGAVLSSDGKKVTLTTSAHTSGQSYVVTVNNVKDLAGNVINPNANTAGYSFFNDTTPPELTGASLSGNKTVLLTFSEELDETSAEVISNYSIDKGISIDSATLLNGGTVVSLSTSAHSPNTIYTVTVNNVLDLAGNIISSQGNSAQYQKESGGGGGKRKISIGRTSAQWFQNYVPDNSIDGDTDPASDSRWAGVLPMPDSIVFDLDGVYTINETHFSFYRWDQGRIYNFSVQVSVDGVNWTEVLTDMVSSSAQWSINQFDSVEARYVKLISLSNNESQWAGLWEAEIWGPDQTTENVVVNKIPADFNLEQNYPNPFNPTTTIKFNVPSDQHVRINVYNIIGEMVTELANNNYSAGNYAVEFNAANLPSGIYIYRLESQSFTSVRKMILMK